MYTILLNDSFYKTDLDKTFINECNILIYVIKVSIKSFHG